MSLIFSRFSVKWPSLLIESTVYTTLNELLMPHEMYLALTVSLKYADVTLWHMDF